MANQHWNQLPYLDALRPEPDWAVDKAILTTYSADLVAVVAALLALAGLDDDRGSGSKVDFANAYEQLRGKVSILVQAGRIAWPNKKLPILSILDRFLKEIPADEKTGSWHPKVALVKMIHEKSNDIQWRLWIGSRNLTRSMDWDAGLVLVGHHHQEGQTIPGIAHLGFELAQMTALEGFKPAQVQETLQQIRWQCPKGASVESLHLLTPFGKRGLPKQPKNIRRLFVISPFIDGTTIKKLGKWGDKNTKRWLLSTQSYLARLHQQSGQPLARFQQILTLDSPDPDGEEYLSEEIKVDTESSEDKELESRGVHAKLIYAEHGNEQGTLWLGSANATIRGWAGPNTEAVAQLNIDSSFANGLDTFLGMANVVNLDTLPPPVDDDPDEMLLEEARKEVATRWQVTQQVQNKVPQLKADNLPHPDNKEVKLEVGLLACDLVLWPQHQAQIQLSSIARWQVTELIQVRLSLGQRHCIWLQQAPLHPQPDEERDRQAFAHHLDPRTFLLWIRSLLKAEDIGDGGGDWDAEPSQHRQLATNGPGWWAPTLEEVLKAWTRNPNSLLNIDRKVENYLKLVQELQENDHNKDEQKILDEFQQTWDIVRKILIGEGK